MRRNPRRHVVAAWAFVVPALVYVLVFFGYPIVNNLVMSFQEFTTKSFYTGQAPFVGLRNYAEVIGSDLFVRLTVNTALFTVLSLASTFAIGLALALFFNRHFRLGGLLRSLLLLPWLLLLIVSAATWRRDPSSRPPMSTAPGGCARSSPSSCPSAGTRSSRPPCSRSCSPGATSSSPSRS
ncbi:hypothetical protein GCM10023320_84450 [Pseudonocardia adelaidensis]|uniref:Uncharacterized protein n=1 Tax=Pseudonocardia adelaidensis TaxID=648754 RepID=A0ABP9PE75_9PSEU